MRYWKSGLLFTICLAMVLAVAGCAEIKPPKPREIMHEPLGESPLRVGMTREEVKSLWGQADVVRTAEGSDNAVLREEWIYQGRYPNLPINVDYLAETQHLFFDGEHLVEFRHEK
jgi:hypothetical protein